MRGARYTKVKTRPKIGIIPADAGSTISCWTCGRVSKDHPRGCGEHPYRLRMNPMKMGSSPRMRGALIQTIIIVLFVGIIPADAGSTRPDSPIPVRVGDHPRGCGEHSVIACMRIVHLGSSPRMRGALRWRAKRGRRRGIIPADAGSTGPHLLVPHGYGDHPRGCGEHR